VLEKLDERLDGLDCVFAVKGRFELLDELLSVVGIVDKGADEGTPTVNVPGALASACTVSLPATSHRLTAKKIKARGCARLYGEAKCFAL
jgi:hypothetical protein